MLNVCKRPWSARTTYDATSSWLARSERSRIDITVYVSHNIQGDFRHKFICCCAATAMF